MLPGYLAEAISRFGDPALIVVQVLQRFVDQLDAHDTDSLAVTYLRLERDEQHARALRELATAHPKSSEAHRAWSLILILEELGRRDLSPFNGRKLQLRPTRREADWSTTPAAVQAWAELADQFGVLGDGEMLQMADETADTDAATYGRLLRKWNDVWPQLEDWLDRNPVTLNECAWRLYRLSTFLNYFDGV